MKYFFLCMSALFFVGCSSSSGGGGGGVVSYKYTISGTTPFSTDEASPLAAPFTIKWNEVAGVITGVYTEGSTTRTVTGTSNGGGRTMSMAINPPESGVVKITLIIATAGDLNGTVSATVKAFDAGDVELSSTPISVTATTTTAGGGGGTAISMPTISCPSGVSAIVPSQGNMLYLNMNQMGPIQICIGASNTFTIYGESVTDGTYTYTLPNGPSGRIGNFSATWDSNAMKVMAAFCFATSTPTGTVSLNMLDNGALISDTGTFQGFVSHMNCP